MFLMLSPFTFFFTYVYLFLMFFLFFVSDFYMFWVFMEFTMLLFIGISYSVYISNVSGLMFYFLIQSVSSLNIFLFYFLGYFEISSVFILMKMGLFPFYVWYINVCFFFPNFIFYLANSFQKFPLLLMIFMFFNSNVFSVFFFSFFFTVFLCGFMVLNTLDFRMILLISSVVNNSWLVMSQMVLKECFFLFLIFYFVNMFVLMLYFNNNLKLILSNTNHSQQNSFYFYMLLLTSISGLPPFPLFFMKVMIISLLFFNGLVGVLVLLFVLLANVMLMVSYFQFMFFMFINQKTSVFGQYFTF